MTDEVQILKFMALSSGEAELYGILKGATQTKGLISMMADFGEETVCSDAHRQGFAKTRQMEVQHLWVQVKEVSTNNNPADLLTKAMNGETMRKDMGFDVDSSRANTVHNKLSAGLQEWRLVGQH